MLKQKYHIITYGCQMNESDSERMNSFLDFCDWQAGGLEQADFVFLNLCSVRKAGIDRVWSKIYSIKESKNKNNKVPKIILTGCILPDDKKRLGKIVDYILNIKDLIKWPGIISELKCKIEKENFNMDDYFSVPPDYKSKFEAYVPIMTGCDNFCSYCAVPYTRGREVSRTAQEIIDEVNKLVVQDYKHITLLGQNVNSYRPTDVSNQATNNFANLLKEIDKIPGDFWLTFLTSHPKDMSHELIKCFDECQHLIPYLHLPFQAGSDKILKAMNRKYSISDYVKLIEKVRERKNEISLTTDIIVGYPGETENDFQQTVDLVKKIKFDGGFISRYSPRVGTASAKLEDDVSVVEKKHREKILNDILKQTSLEKNQAMLNKKVQVLVHNKKDDYYLGRTRNFKNVKIFLDKAHGQANLVGKFVQVQITDAMEWILQGKLIN